MNAPGLQSSVRVVLLAAAMAMGCFAAPATIELRSFGARSFAEIKQAHAGRPFIIAFWSVTCEPCREEMMVVTEVHKKHPKIPIILVAADPPGTRAQVLRFLGNYPLGRIETWQFDDDASERLRYSVDRSWAGELPRSYFFNAAHELTAQSGIVDLQWLQQWIERESKAARPSK
jgi:thiol-disulfide isomerase/thioredoxin